VALATVEKKSRERGSTGPSADELRKLALREHGHFDKSLQGKQFSRQKPHH
jgi:hypothetical protein